MSQPPRGSSSDAPARALVGFTWLSAVIYLPIETYLSWREPLLLELSGYLVDVLGISLSLWGAECLRARRPHGAGLLAAGWAWTTATLWRGTNLRYFFAGRGDQLGFGPIELWLGPVFTIAAAAALVASLVLLIRRSGGSRRDQA